MEETLRSDFVLSQINSRNRDEKIIEVDEAMLNVLVFQLGGYLFAFHGDQSREILPFRGVTWIPGATASLPGVVNVRGDIVAALDLRHVLGIAGTEDKTGGYLIMMRAGDGRTGIIVDRIIDVAEIPLSANGMVLPTLDERFRRLASSQFEYHQQMATVLDLTAMLETVHG